MPDDLAAYELGMTRRPPDVVEVAVPVSRRATDVPGVLVRRRVDLDRATARVLPPRTRAPETVVDLLPACRDQDAVVALLCDGVRAGAHPQSVRELLLPKPRWRWRGLALAALQQCEAGIESPLELRFHADVLRGTDCPCSRRRCASSSTGGGSGPTPAVASRPYGSSSTAGWRTRAVAPTPTPGATTRW